MKSFLSISIILLMICSITLSQKAQKDYPIKPVPFTKVKLTDNFWAPRLKTDKDVTIPIAFQKSDETGRIKNFRIAAGLEEGKFCTQYPFDDSDVFKNIEAASYILQLFPDPKLDLYLDSLITIIGAAQENDGYLYTTRTIDPTNPHEWSGMNRWEKDEELSHELYNAGHLYEAAAAHFMATGKKSLLNIALKNAELIDKVFGWGKLEIVPGHQVIEMGLVKLYRITGEEKYLKLAQFFLDKRGSGNNVQFGEYAQMHKPVIEQDSAVGHAVRAQYMYSGMADVAALTGNTKYTAALDKIWEDVVFRKFYITGGTGAAGGYEGFGPAYELPNLSAYCETCASIASMFWNYRMFLLKGESKYFDVLERVMYNSFLSGISLSGDRFFYPNPLASTGDYERSAWFGCACCPVNVSRALPAIPGYIYASDKKGIYINLFIQSETEFDFDEQIIGIKQQTEYPWDGKILLTINPSKEEEFSVMIRIPGWAIDQPVPGDLYFYSENLNLPVTIYVNGEPQSYNLENGYAVINRKWQKNDILEIELPMPIRKVIANEKVEADKNKVALERGPIVFCAEGADNSNGKVLNIIIDDETELSTEFRTNLLNGVQIINGNIKASKKVSENEIETEEQEFLAIPYYAWENRGPNEMTVWFAENVVASSPTPLPTIASKSKITSSHPAKRLQRLNDQYIPANSNDQNTSYYHCWPTKGTSEWIQYDFEKEEAFSASQVYWFDDENTGGECRIPQSYSLKYLSGEEWIPVKNIDEYKIEKDKFNIVQFEKIKTTALRLEYTMQKEFSIGIYEWVIK
ncbi:MAG: beta-L-arabinofuranosidase domain-containing protein [bacterium]